MSHSIPGQSFAKFTSVRDGTGAVLRISDGAT
jgi:hypothetical protein